MHNAMPDHACLSCQFTVQHLRPHADVPQDFAGGVRAFGNDLEAWPEEQRQRALQMIVHACDIGNPAKSLDSSLLWSERILAENFAQVKMLLLQRVKLSPPAS